MSARRRTQTDPPGQDSFLDVVANLVGILIILVVVIGAHAGATWVSQSEDEAIAEQREQLEIDAEQARLESTSREAHNREVEVKIKQESADMQLLERERDELLLRISVAEQALNEQLAQSSSQRQATVELAGQLQQSRTTLISLQREIAATEAQQTGPSVIEHLPTPIAKTVFTNEIHFRLKNNRLSFVPLNELVDEMRNEWRVQADNLKFASETVETVGPINGFRMQYKLALVEQTLMTEYGEVTREGPEFIGFVILPTSDQLGTTIDEALQTNSWLDRQLRRFSPNDTTITVWVYPDSYDDFAVLKRWLFERNYLTAGWPLPDGQPISGGPNGYRSTAQ